RASSPDAVRADIRMAPSASCTARSRRSTRSSGATPECALARTRLRADGRPDMGDGTALRLHVDRIRCDAYGMCAELLPELVELDDWGYPIVRAGDVPADLLAHARRAVEACPVLALRLAHGLAPRSAAPAPGRRAVAPGQPAIASGPAAAASKA